MKAFILAAGLGTRLRPLTEKVAKPALPIVGIPSLWFPAWQIKRRLGVAEFMVNASHAPDTVRSAAADKELSAFTGIRFEVSDESSELLGTSGALKKVEAWVGRETLVVANGDVVSDFDMAKMLEFHKKKKSKLTLHLRGFDGQKNHYAEPYVNVDCGADGTIKNFGVKSTQGVMFSGTYLIEPDLFTRLPAGFSDLRPALLEPLAVEGKLFGYREDCEWFDTGTVASYAKANFELLSKIPAYKPLVEVKMRNLNAGSWVPKAWIEKGVEKRFDLTAPCVLLGNPLEWERVAGKEFGPKFLGLAPPRDAKS